MGIGRGEEGERGRRRGGGGQDLKLWASGLWASSLQKVNSFLIGSLGSLHRDAKVGKHR